MKYFLLLSFLTILSSCVDKEKKEITIELISDRNITTEKEFPQLIKSLLEPIDLDSLGYVPTIVFKRLDLNKDNTISYSIPTNEIGEFQKSLDTYAFSDYESDYLEANFENNKLLYEPSASNRTIITPSSDYIYFQDSTKVTGLNAYGSIASLRKAIINDLAKNINKNKIVISLGKPEIVNGDCSPANTKFEQYIRAGEWESAIIVAEELVVFNCNVAVKIDSLIVIGDENFKKSKALNTLDMIDIPMGYYAVAYALALDEGKVEIERKYKECLKYIESKGKTINIINLPKDTN